MNLRGVLNRLLAPLGYEARPRQPAPAAFSMDAVLQRLSQRGVEIGTIIDVGAASGRWSRKALPLFPGAHLLMVEPLEERRAALETLCAAHAPRAHYALAAAGAQPGSAQLSVASDLDGSGLYGSDSGSPVREVPVISIDSEIERLQLPPPYLLKLDTHGYEIPILAGASNTLARTNALLAEVYNFEFTPGCLRFHELCADLERRGFRTADLADPMLRPGDELLWQMDLLFLPANSPFFRQHTYRVE